MYEKKIVDDLNNEIEFVLFFLLFTFFWVECSSPPPPEVTLGPRFKEEPRRTTGKLPTTYFTARMMFIPGLRRELRVLAFLLTAYFMSQTWTGKAQCVDPLQCRPFLASLRFGIRRRSEICRFTKL